MSILSKIALKIIKHELQKQTPELRNYLIKEVNLLCDKFKDIVDKEIIVLTDSIVSKEENKIG